MRVFVKQYLCSYAEGAGSMESVYSLFVILAVGKLLLYLLNSAATTVAEPGGKLFRAFLAHIAVLKLAVAKEPYFSSADRAYFFLKQFTKESHLLILLSMLLK